MKHFKVIVPKLNVRTAPVAGFKNKSNIINTISNGFEIDLDEETNVPNPSLGKWYKDTKGQYYWGGGVMEMGENVTLKNLAQLSDEINYNSLVKDIPISWRITEGKDIVVAILDTGVATISKNQLDIVKGYNALTNTEDDYEDTFGHGTFVAGLIGANGTNKISGFAPKIKLIIVKISDDGYFSSNNAFKGLKWLDEVCKITPDIINISADFPETSGNKEFFKSNFTSFKNKGTIIYASAGDDVDLFNQNIFFPAIAPNVIAIGKLNINNPTGSIINPKIKFIGGEYSFTSINNFSPKVGSSYSTAAISGISALALADYKLSNHSLSKEDFIQKQFEIFSNQNFNNSLKIYKQ